MLWNQQLRERRHVLTEQASVNNDTLNVNLDAILTHDPSQLSTSMNIDIDTNVTADNS